MKREQPESPARAAAALATEALASFGRLSLRVTGASMLPALRPGDVMEFRASVSTLANAGDIVLFRRDGSLVVHRVVARTAAGLITQGDSLARPDPPVAHADVLGRVVGLTRGSRRVAWNRPFRPGLPVTRWLFRRFDLASRLFLRWHRISARTAA